MTAKELQEQRAQTAAEIRKMADLLNDEKRDFNTEEQERWEKVNADYDGKTAQLKILERAESIASDQDKANPENRDIGREDYDGRHAAGSDPDKGPDKRSAGEKQNVALRAWARTQAGEPLTEDDESVCKELRRNPHASSFDLELRRERYPRVRREMRALSIADPAAGGVTVPEGFVNNFERALLEFGGMRSVADVIRTDTGADWPWPHSDDTSNTGAILAENVTVAEQDIAFGAMVMKAYKYTSKLVKVSFELLNDSAFDFAAILGEMLGERIGRINNTHFTTGLGDGNQPKGVITAAAVGKTAASATAIAADEIYDLIHSVDPAYRRQNAGFMMHDNILLAIRKLKDGDGRYLWTEGLDAGQSDKLAGRPITINQDMASSVATGNKTIAFGAFRFYKIRDVGSFRLRRLVERYADADQEGFVAFTRHDGNLLDAGTNPVKVLKQA